MYCICTLIPMMMISYIILKISTEHANKSTTNDNENTKKSILSRLLLKVLDIFLLKRTWNWRTFSQRHLWSDSFNLCSFPIILFDKKYSIINFLFFNCYILTRSYIQIINNNICLQLQKIIDVDREVTKKLKWTGSFSLFLFHFSVRLECLSLRF